MKKLLLPILLVASLFAYNDSDLDGVADEVDKCPNTPLTDLADANGCSKKSLVSNNHFDIIIGGEYSQSEYKATPTTDTYNTSVQVDYYYKNFSLQALTSYYNTSSDGYSDSGMNDSTISMSYNLHLNNALTLKLGTGVILPTYDATLNNNNTDYFASLNISYVIKNTTFFAGYNYTLINDDDIHDSSNDIDYQSTNSFSGGIGYNFSPKLYISASYFQAQSIYKNVEDLASASVFLFYSFNENYFTNISYVKGLSDSTSDNSASIKLGYYF